MTETEGESTGAAGWRRYLTKRLILRLGLAATVLFIFWFIPYVPALKWDQVTVTRWERVRGKVRVEVGPKVKGWVELNKVSKHVIYAVVAAEDGRFFTHNGIDLTEMKKSFEANLQKGRLARGGSTITQQVVKMAFLGREKTYLRKSREVVGALLLEMLMTKDEIMEWYLNLAEFGDAVYGIERASWHYFKTKPQLLSIEQAVHLALVLPSPNGWSKGLRNRNLTKFGHQRFRVILQTMRGDGYITKNQQQQAMARGNFGSPIHGFVSDVPEDPIDDLAGGVSGRYDINPDEIFKESSFRDNAPLSSDGTKKNPLDEILQENPSQDTMTGPVPEGQPAADSGLDTSAPPNADQAPTTGDATVHPPSDAVEPTNSSDSTAIPDESESDPQVRRSAEE